jgi:hypothetical protein
MEASHLAGRELDDTSESEGSPKNQPDNVVVKRISLLGYSQVGTTPSAEAKLLCCFLLDKSILGIVALEDR